MAEGQRHSGVSLADPAAAGLAGSAVGAVPRVPPKPVQVSRGAGATFPHVSPRWIDFAPSLGSHWVEGCCGLGIEEAWDLAGRGGLGGGVGRV